MHYLLSTVDPVKCAKTIPWPLTDNTENHSFAFQLGHF